MATVRADEPWTSTPLPSGWEAKYDIIQKRYFFVDHVNKTTSWEDPRYKLWQQQQQQQHSGSAQSAAQSTSSGASHQLRTQTTSHSHSHTDQLKTNSSTEQHRATSPSRHGDQSRGSTPSRQGNGNQGNQARGDNLRAHINTTKPRHSQAQPTEDLLKMVRTQLLAEFPGSSLTVVQLALESCSFDETKARQLLQSLAASDTLPAKPSATTTSTTTSTTTGTTTRTNTAAASSSTVQASSGHSTSTSQHSASAIINSIFASDIHRASHTLVPPAGTQSSKVSATRPSAITGSSVTDTTSTLAHCDAKSPHNSLAKGHDAGLVAGPNKKLLLSDYVPSCGPQPSLHTGPDAHNCVGPCVQHVNGPQLSLVTGPSVAMH